MSAVSAWKHSTGADRVFRTETLHGETFASNIEEHLRDTEEDCEADSDAQRRLEGDNDVNQQDVDIKKGDRKARFSGRDEPERQDAHDDDRDSKRQRLSSVSAPHCNPQCAAVSEYWDQRRYLERERCTKDVCWRWNI